MSIEWKESPTTRGKIEGYVTGGKVANVWTTTGIPGIYRCIVWLDVQDSDGTEMEVSADFVHNSLDGAKLKVEKAFSKLVEAWAKVEPAHE